MGLFGKGKASSAGGTDWDAKKEDAGSNAGQQHESWTTADGPVNRDHQHPMGDSDVLDMVEGE